MNNEKFNKIINKIVNKFPLLKRKNDHGLSTLIGVTRLEVIDEKGRAYTRWDLGNVTVNFQDEGRTLKIFVKGENNEKESGTKSVKEY